MTKTKLTELARRAAIIKADSTKRHTPNKHDLAKASENTNTMQIPQFQSIHQERTDS